MDEAKKTALHVDCDRCLKWAFHAPGVASVLGYYCYDKGHLRGLAHGGNRQHTLTASLRQSVFRRLAGAARSNESV